MDWQKLLSKKMLGSESTSQFEDNRSRYQRDFDRIVFSSAFRRLQDKTQVFPLPESDFVHTRLTHSLEVSCVGRSLGNLVGEKLLAKNKKMKDEFTQFHWGEIVAAACLAHDIGNPPFGHSGEDAIAEYFRSGRGAEYKKELKDEKKWNDFIKFEGNAQGFRILTKLQNPNIRGGLQLTCGTLAAFTKYPKESTTPAGKNNVTKKKLINKFGFFQSEKELFIEVAEETGLVRKNSVKGSLCWSRHPLAFLVEAADDICYRIMDLEDGFRLGLLSFNDTEDLLMPLVNSTKLKEYANRDNNDKIGYLRAKAINELVVELADGFMNFEKDILAGDFENDLISIIPRGSHLEYIKKLSIDQIYSYKSVLEREAAGYEVLGGLLDAFLTAVTEEATNTKTSFKSRNLIKLLPRQFMGRDGEVEQDIYQRLLKITDFVSGMTDTYAVSLFRKIKGISLPNR